jgi:hypothetical protein
MMMVILNKKPWKVATLFKDDFEIKTLDRGNLFQGWL